MGDAHTLAEYEIPAEVSADRRDAEAGQSTQLPGAPLVPAAKEVCGGHQRRRRNIQHPVNEADTLRAPVGLAPVRETGHGRADRAREAECEGKIGGTGVGFVPARGRLRVQGYRRRPRAERNRGERRVKRMVEPHAVQRVLDGHPDAAGIPISRHDRFAERLGNAIEFGLSSDARESCVGHDPSTDVIYEVIAATAQLPQHSTGQSRANRVLAVDRRLPTA